MASSGDLEAAYHAWANAPPGSAEEPHLLDALFRSARAQINRVLHAKSAGSREGTRPADLEDACQNALLKLWRTLQRSGKRAGPGKITQYVNAAARNAFYDLLRRANPSWFSMAACILWRVRHSNNILYVDRDGDLLYALSETLTGSPEIDHSRLEMICEELRRERDWSRVPLERLLCALLRAAEQPLSLDLLADLCLLCTGAQRRTISLDEELGPNLRLIDLLEHGGRTPEQTTLDCELLRWVWKELGDLPGTQRRVCGLNLDSAAGLRLEVFLLSGVVTRAGYETLLRPLMLRHLPYFPPLAEEDIAGLLGLEKKKVSNRRVSAQRRIARRFLNWISSKGRKAGPSASWSEGLRSRT